MTIIGIIPVPQCFSPTDRIDRKGLAKQDWHNRTPEQNRENRTGRTGQDRQDMKRQAGHDKTGRT